MSMRREHVQGKESWAKFQAEMVLTLQKLLQINVDGFQKTMSNYDTWTFHHSQG
jgi:hypothetical protein